MRGSLPKICLISSHGGHLHELMNAIKGVDASFYWVTYKTNHTRLLLKERKHYFIIDPNIYLWKYFINGIQSVFHIIKERPKIIISTGAGIAIPTIIIGKYLLSSKILYVESAAAVTQPSKTGRFIYKHSDLFLVQWQDLLKFYPRAKYAGLL